MNPLPPSPFQRLPIAGSTALLAAALLAAYTGQGQAQTPDNASRIQPRDGHWNWNVGAVRSSASCVPGVADTLLQLLPAARSEYVRFETPFHPQQLIEHSLVQWQQRSPNHFVATAAGATVQGFALPMNVRYELHVLSPTRMRGEGVAEMNVWQPCSVSAPFEFERQDSVPGQPPFMPPPRSAG